MVSANCVECCNSLLEYDDIDDNIHVQIRLFVVEEAEREVSLHLSHITLELTTLKAKHHH